MYTVSLVVFKHEKLIMADMEQALEDQYKTVFDDDTEMVALRTHVRALMGYEHE